MILGLTGPLAALARETGAPSRPAAGGAKGVAAATSVPAVPDAEALSACAGVAEAAARLACYDRALGRPIEPRPGPDDKPEAPPSGDFLSPGLASPPVTGAPDQADPRTPTLANPPSNRPRLPSLLPERIEPAQASRFQREALEERRSLGSTLADRWELEPAYDRGRFTLSPYKPMYVLLADWTSRKNPTPTSPNPLNNVVTPISQRSTEASFQISFKTKIIEDMIAGHGDLWLGYTQQSHWQIYHPGESRPFRETNYEPEVIATFRTDYSLLGWRGRLVGLSLNHQSNGRGETQSRSWNRIIGMVGLERGNWTMMLRPWWRIPESADVDDNPDIQDYAGRLELLLVHQRDGHELSLLARHSLRDGGRSHAAIQIGYAMPISSYLKGYVQLFSGYGASLLDYNHRQTRIGIGISMMQWL